MEAGFESCAILFHWRSPANRWEHFCCWMRRFEHGFEDVVALSLPISGNTGGCSAWPLRRFLWRGASDDAQQFFDRRASGSIPDSSGGNSIRNSAAGKIALCPLAHLSVKTWREADRRTTTDSRPIFIYWRF